MAKEKKKREVKRSLSKPGCKCYKQEIFLDLNFSLSLADLPYFIEKGYKGKESYRSSGIFYIYNESLIALGAVGNTKLTIKCRNKGCFEGLDRLEEVIKEM